MSIKTSGELMKKLAVTLHRRLDTPDGRNEKIKSRLQLFKEKGWDIDIYYIIEPETEIDLWRFISVFWQAFLAVLKICSSYRDKDKYVLWTMNDPPYLHIPGLIVKKLIEEIKWVPEFRDEMCEDPFYSRKPKPTKVLSFFLEPFIMRNADLVLKGKGGKCTDQYFDQKYPENAEKVSDSYYQGYDKNKTKNIVAKDFDRFTILYAGRFYKNWIEPITFLKGLSMFVEENDIAPKDLEVKFHVKKWANNYDEVLKENELEPFVEINDFVEFEEIISIMKGSDLCLYIAGVNKSHKNMINSKFWDYIATRSTILLLSEEDFLLNKIVRKFNLGFVAMEEEPKDIAKKLEKAYKEGHSGYKNKDELDKLFDRDKYDETFFDQIEDLV